MGSHLWRGATCWHYGSRSMLLQSRWNSHLTLPTVFIEAEPQCSLLMLKALSIPSPRVSNTKEPIKSLEITLVVKASSASVGHVCTHPVKISGYFPIPFERSPEASILLKRAGKAHIKTSIGAPTNLRKYRCE